MKWLLALAICLLTALEAHAQKFAPAQYLAADSVPTAPAHVHPAVARIVAPGNGSVSYGSGTLVYTTDSAGLVITNWHVVNEAAGPVSVHFPDGFYSLGNVLRIDRDWDLAAIVIRKPNAQPVALANEAPRPGETLTIAGYGSGTYRAVSGPCTQYVAPGETFPYEMVELAASARQGDSGGPIFNARGELAGVLFGEGHGRTSGSYCGRVRWFLSSVVPTVGQHQQVATTALRPVPERPSSGATIATSEAQVANASPPAPAIGHTIVVPISQPARVATAAPEKPALVASTPSPDGPVPVAQTLSWQDLAGETPGQQAKTVLAAIGALAVLLHALRWLSREPKNA